MKILQRLYSKAVYLNYSNIKSLLERDPEAVFLDLGCDNGEITMKMAREIRTKNIIGIDIVTDRIKIAKKKGIKTIESNLNRVLPIASKTVSVVHANQVIEHVGDVDLFLEEICRVLKPGGYAIISTENASSWCNILALILGWQMFSLTNISSKTLGVGNPLAFHRDEKITLNSWKHKTIFSYLGLIEFVEAWGFEVEAVRGAGYFPLAAAFGNIDKRHCHFITIKIRKPDNKL
jgi:2-polyprenyl-3-methyl-5-hydroxy-6-metoxy-1,4-benzoquinol methylase